MFAYLNKFACKIFRLDNSLTVRCLHFHLKGQPLRVFFGSTGSTSLTCELLRKTTEYIMRCFHEETPLSLTPLNNWYEVKSEISPWTLLSLQLPDLFVDECLVPDTSWRLDVSGSTRFPLSATLLLNFQRMRQMRRSAGSCQESDHPHQTA